MARALRFEFVGVICHVINRGKYRSWMFESDAAKAGFESCLFEASERVGGIVHAR